LSIYLDSFNKLLKLDFSLFKHFVIVEQSVLRLMSKATYIAESLDSLKARTH
jgi:hypothetical protein